MSVMNMLLGAAGGGMGRMGAMGGAGRARTAEIASDWLGKFSGLPVANQLTVLHVACPTAKVRPAPGPLTL